MNITIVGLGVIGGSFAKALKAFEEHEVYGIDNDISTLNKAESLGIIKKGYLDGKEPLEISDLVILCIYPMSVLKFIESNKQYFKKGAIITDATGVKGIMVDDILDSVGENVDFVFGHPMAGREKKGIDFASAEVFKGANYILTPHHNNKAENLKIVEDLVYSIGFSNVKKVNPYEHDKIVAYTSQLPHAMAVALVNSDDDKYPTGELIGDSYRDLTRIANINEELWSELFLSNRENLISTIEVFQGKLEDIKKSLVNNDKEKLIEIFKESSRRREKL
ncbi:prephenate dehydrogenase [Clostridium sp. YIM B02505]|uniref:Prephenate dehydrogenase n=1 Tax=Clostridium yunnanense TaxID=2800325 RepID=A0ABS1EI94_9CLOT|nr:prephenate dehydrogenase [Clostridium yunnanense]MBK1809072.1 prephenate dehydrogenase [Clostridium yunnanense]